MELLTRRLILIPCPREVAELASSDPVRAGAALGIQVPPGWPDSELRPLLPVYASLLAADPDRLGWGPWLVVVAATSMLVGSAGFLDLPRQGTVEIGYGIVPGHRNRGYATEAAGALVGWALAAPSVERVVARCRADNAPSIRVLERIGMCRTGEEHGIIGWALARGKG